MHARARFSHEQSYEHPPPPPPQQHLVREPSPPTHHVELGLAADEGGHGEGDEAAGGEGQIRVDDGAVLVVAGGEGAVEARPVHPQEDGACDTRGGDTVRTDAAALTFFRRYKRSN